MLNIHKIKGMEVHGKVVKECSPMENSSGFVLTYDDLSIGRISLKDFSDLVGYSNMTKEETNDPSRG